MRTEYKGREKNADRFAEDGMGGEAHVKEARNEAFPRAPRKPEFLATYLGAVLSSASG